MRKTIVINLTRFGDLIQTQPVLSGYKAMGDHVVLVCLENFAAAADLLADVDLVIPLPGASFLAELERDWTGALHALWDFRSKALAAGEEMRVVNLTPSLSSRLLGRFLSRDEVVGFGLDMHGFGQYSSPWANFLQAASRLRGCSPFNLVDVLVRVGHLQNEGNRPHLKEPDSKSLSWCAGILKEELPAGCKGYIAFQLGASEDKRRWPVESFAALGDHLWATHRLCPLVVGTAGEKSLGERYARHTSAPWIDFQGRTTLPQLGAVLAQSRVLVTNDTGTMHMAAGLGVPLVALFMATAQPWDTGPYSENCVCLEPEMDCHPCPFGSECERDHRCRQQITPATVAALLDGYTIHGTWELAAGQGVRGWKTTLDDGLMDLLSLTGDTSDRYSWIRIQRWYYRHFLDKKRLVELAISYPLTQSSREEIGETLHECAGLLHLLREQGALLTRLPGPVIRKKFMATWQRIQTKFDQSQWFGILGLLWLYESQDAGAGDLNYLFTLLERYAQLIQALLVYVESDKVAQ